VYVRTFGSIFHCPAHQPSIQTTDRIPSERKGNKRGKKRTHTHTDTDTHADARARTGTRTRTRTHHLLKLNVKRDLANQTNTITQVVLIKTQWGRSSSEAPSYLDLHLFKVCHGLQTTACTGHCADECRVGYDIWCYFGFPHLVPEVLGFLPVSTCSTGGDDSRKRMACSAHKIW
jgi:hypothetical protein